MKSSMLVALCFVAAGCTSIPPEQHARDVAAMAGRKPLRVGVVVLGGERSLPEAFPDMPAAPGGAAVRPRTGDVYAEQSLLPESLPAEQVVDALQNLGAFTDVVLLPFDSRGIASRAGVIQRVQDRVWSTAIEQELDALLVIEGVRDEGLRWSDEDEGLFTLDTALWWLAWPFGLWIPDRTYTADCRLIAAMFWLGDPAVDPLPDVLTSTPTPHSLAPWARASAPLLGLVVPPVWVADDAAAVADAVGETSRAMLPIELVRQVKLASLGGPFDSNLQLGIDDGDYLVSVRSVEEIAHATLATLPRGALTDASAVEPVDVPLVTSMEMTADGPQHTAVGTVASAVAERSVHPLVRVSVTLVSGAIVSQTWAIDELSMSSSGLRK